MKKNSTPVETTHPVVCLHADIFLKFMIIHYLHTVTQRPLVHTRHAAFPSLSHTHTQEHSHVCSSPLCEVTWCCKARPRLEASSQQRLCESVWLSVPSPAVETRLRPPYRAHLLWDGEHLRRVVRTTRRGTRPSFGHECFQ